MRKLLFVGVLLSCMVFDSCTKSATIDKEYLLVEVLSDPGDGSGVFEAVTSNKKLILFDDDTFKIENGKFCTFEEGASLEASGTIDFAEGQIYGNDCAGSRHLFTVDGEYLIINYLCIEACAQKYKEL